MNPELPSELRPIESRAEIPAALPRPTSHSTTVEVARWRWWIALLIIGSSPLLAALSSTQRAASPSDGGAMLPSSVVGLLLFCALQMGAFGAIWAISWAFSRADKDQLFLRWSGWKSLAWGVLYSLLMRFGIVIVAVFVLTVLVIFGFDPKEMMKVMQSSGENVQRAFAPIFAGRDPLYKFLVITLVSFVVAGLREELWRAATLAGMLHLAPKKWSIPTKNGVALVISSLLFGMGHLYQGAAGVVGTTLLGIALGAILLRHKSVWPAVVAHGCFNAVSFAALAFGVGAKPGP